MATTPGELKDDRPFEMQLGYDVPRIWVTGAQFFGNADHVLMVLREQTGAAGPDGQVASHIRNVGSIVMPLETARAVHASLGEVIGKVADVES